MAIIAVLMGLSVFAISIVQSKARDTARRNKLKEIEIVLNATISAGFSLPGGFAGTGLPQNTPTELFFPPSNGNTIISIPDFLNRGSPDYKNEYFTVTSAYATDYCFQRVGSIYIVGMQLEDGTWATKSNTLDYSVFYYPVAPCISNWM
jgi:hypothetical protein